MSSRLKALAARGRPGGRDCLGASRRGQQGEKQCAGQMGGCGDKDFGARALRNLGLKSAAALAHIGVGSADELVRKDLYVLYARLRARDPKTRRNFLYALIGAMQDLWWQPVKRERRRQILLRMEAIGLHRPRTPDAKKGRLTDRRP